MNTLPIEYVVSGVSFFYTTYAGVVCVVWSNNAQPPAREKRAKHAVFCLNVFIVVRATSQREKLDT